MTELTIPNNVYVPCPEKGFVLRKLSICFQCKHLIKPVDLQPDNDIKDCNFIEKYQILCGRPITRALVQVSED